MRWMIRGRYVSWWLREISFCALCVIVLFGIWLVFFGGPCIENMGTVIVTDATPPGFLGCWNMRMTGGRVDPDALYWVRFVGNPLVLNREYDLVRRMDGQLCIVEKYPEIVVQEQPVMRAAERSR